MKNKLQDRRFIILIVFTLFFIALGVRLANITVVNGEYYRELSVNKRLKQIPELAKRGEVFDRNGILIAGNIPAFTVKLSGSNLSSLDLNKVAVKLLSILDNNEEDRIRFPIQKQDDNFYFTYDDNILKYLIDNDYEVGTSAENVYHQIRRREQISDELSDSEAQRFLLLNGVSLPLSVNKMKFWSEIEKEEFLESYGLDLDISAKDAFDAISQNKSYGIDDLYTDDEALKILTLKYALKVKGYRKYDPIKVASNLKKETVVLIEEMSMDLPGVNVDVEPVRYYPYNESAAHILGYMGKISSESEIEKFVDKYDYDRNQLIGKVGIEGEFELDLNGEDGYKFIEVDVFGKLIREVDSTFDGRTSKPSKSGSDIQLTIDIELQKKLELYLEKATKAIQVGGTYTSPWGDYNYSDSFPNAKTAAGVVVDVKTGEVLAMASYPSYDVNVFSTGISYDDWESLSSENKRDPLSPRPLYNIATLTAVQPGSIYKMVTGYAAMEQGLDPNKKLYADGFVELGNHQYGCWLWNNYRAKHGMIDLYGAIEESCNYYFFDIASGYDYYKKKPLDFEMNTEILLEYSKQFGLDSKTGIEISETSFGIPDPDRKRRSILNNMKNAIKSSAATYFPESVTSDEYKLSAMIDEIASWGPENPSRGTIIARLEKIGMKDDYTIINKLADLIKYSYFNLIEWSEGDTLNLAIGQGDHKYTTVQMARYIATIANDGYLNELSIVKKVADKVIVKNQDVTNVDMIKNGSLKEMRRGMLDVTSGSRGTANSTFKNFPIQVGGKTGSAEMSGKIAPISEREYLTKYLRQIDSKLLIADVEKRSIEILKDRNEELADLQLEKTASIVEEDRQRLENKITSLFSSGYVSEDSSLRQAVKDLSTKRITDSMLNEFRQNYDDFGWFVSFAPYDDPEIAVVILIPQAAHGGYASPPAKDIIADYFKLEEKTDEANLDTSVQ
ncbi:MAG: penicillin-binding transpeptidase domain-containing protein [Acidaminobacteraceae bacterium]